MNLRAVSILLLLFSLGGCKNKPSNEEATASNATSKDNISKLAVDPFFDLQRYKPLFRHKNELSSIPLWSDTLGETNMPVILDSNTVKTIYQDSENHYFPSGVGSGNQFYAYIDTFKNFNLVCMYTGQGDGGDLYDLITFTKAGKRISKLYAIAYFQGEEAEWDYNQIARIVGGNINVIATACHTTFDSKGVGNSSICDTLRSYYWIKENGEISLLKRDSVLNHALDSIRRAVPYN